MSDNLHIDAQRFMELQNRLEELQKEFKQVESELIKNMMIMFNGKPAALPLRSINRVVQLLRDSKVSFDMKILMPGLSEEVKKEVLVPHIPRLRKVARKDPKIAELLKSAVRTLPGKYSIKVLNLAPEVEMPILPVASEPAAA